MAFYENFDDKSFIRTLLIKTKISVLETDLMRIDTNRLELHIPALSDKTLTR